MPFKSGHWIYFEDGEVDCLSDDEIIRLDCAEAEKAAYAYDAWICSLSDEEYNFYFRKS